QDEPVPAAYDYLDGQRLIPLRAGESLRWSLA
ncbi:MAG: hypothetical protein RL180_1601, partial [Pseudomonadota bacterium]